MPDAVAGVERDGGRQDGLQNPVLELQGRVGFEAPAREDHAPGRHRRSTGDDAGGGTVGQDEPLGRCTESHLDAAPFDVAAHDFENARTGRRPADVRIAPGRIEAREILDIGKTECPVAGQRVIRRRGAHIELGTDRFAQGARKIGKPGHARRQFGEDGLRRRPGVGGDEIGQRLVRVVGDPKAAGRADRDAAGNLTFLDYQYACTGIVSGNRRHAAGKAVAHDDDVISGQVPSARRPATSSPTMVASTVRPFSAVAARGSPRTPETLWSGPAAGSSRKIDGT